MCAIRIGIAIVIPVDCDPGQRESVCRDVGRGVEDVSWTGVVVWGILGDVSKRVVTEKLHPGRKRSAGDAATDTCDASQVVMAIRATLAITLIEWIIDVQVRQRAVGVPVEIPNYTLAAHVELLLFHAAPVPLLLEDVGISRAKRHAS